MAQITLSVGDVRRFRRFLRADLAGCLIWQGGRTQKGYGLFWLDGRSVLASHVALALAGREIPEGHRVYACPGLWGVACCHPRHLEIRPGRTRPAGDDSFALGGLLGGLVESDIRRFRRQVTADLKTGCLLWTGTRVGRGRGQFWIRGRMAPATHVALAIAGRGVPPGHRAYHACPGGDSRPWCVNPRHLVVETPAAHRRGGARPAAGFGMKVTLRRRRRALRWGPCPTSRHPGGL